MRASNKPLSLEILPQETEKPLVSSGPISTPGWKAKPVLLTRWQSFWALRRIRWHLLKLILNQVPHPLKAIKALRTLITIRRKFLGDSPITKVAKIDGRYYYEYNTPGWPSQAYDDYHLAELNRIMPFQDKPFAFKNVIMAVTKKCAMRCEHCFEWDALNGKEKLTVDNLQNMVRQFQEQGVAQLQFSGGEPMLRMPALLSVLKSAKPITDFWVLTSGHLFTLENAQALKEAGLTGVTISLDHIHPPLHNQFRGFGEAYAWVEKAAENAASVGLVVAVSLCATRAFVTEENLMAYAHLATRLGAAFIQVLEPRAVGHYTGQEVGLAPHQRKMLEDFYTNLNYNPAYHHLPMVVYYDLQRRRAGCAAAADRHVYVDTDGQIQACPFCQKTIGHIQAENFQSSLASLRLSGCPVAPIQ
ncbi:radical SAM protein [Rufibacter hautae]|uniref:Radical SAM protein n=1 Tax=Rufibacter hautae TaxID=2595005 RepID=A0A5B6TEW8_9BACT|nr:radical SAM protein [Rufibacter hautae]